MHVPIIVNWLLINNNNRIAVNDLSINYYLEM